MSVLTNLLVLFALGLGLGSFATETVLAAREGRRVLAWVSAALAAECLIADALFLVSDCLESQRSR